MTSGRAQIFSEYVRTFSAPFASRTVTVSG